MYKLPVFSTFYIQFKNPFLELSMLYIIVILVGLMKAAMIRLKHYEETHKGSDMTKDALLKNVKDANSSVLWKIIFIITVKLHTPVLFLMLFMGN